MLCVMLFIERIVCVRHVYDMSRDTSALTPFSLLMRVVGDALLLNRVTNTSERPLRLGVQIQADRCTALLPTGTSSAVRV